MLIKAQKPEAMHFVGRGCSIGILKPLLYLLVPQTYIAACVHHMLGGGHSICDRQGLQSCLRQSQQAASHSRQKTPILQRTNYYSLD